MARFYFHVVAGIRWEDEDGLELEGDGAARRRALACARAFASRPSDDAAHAIEVTDASGRIVITVPIGIAPDAGVAPTLH